MTLISVLETCDSDVLVTRLVCMGFKSTPVQGLWRWWSLFFLCYESTFMGKIIAIMLSMGEGDTMSPIKKSVGMVNFGS